MEQKLKAIVDERAARGLLRQLTHTDGMVDFSSNDYLGLARSGRLAASIERSWDEWKKQAEKQPATALLGSTGSRLLSGNNHVAEDLERYLAKFHEAEAALLFNSGYDANVGFFSSVPQKDDQVFYDELIHASVHDGMRLSRAKRQSFKHNSIKDLRRLLLQRLQSGPSGYAIIVVESVYSMDGDEAPLQELVELCQEMNAYLVVDEAHGTGVFGQQGVGCVQALGLEKQVFARLHTFGKSLGVHGAAILGSSVLRSFLINYARSLIYTTSLPIHSLISIRNAYQAMAEADKEREHLTKLVKLFRSQLSTLPLSSILPSTSPIQGVVIAGNDEVVKLGKHLQSMGFDVKPIRSPTVPAGTERVRICLHAHNTSEQVTRLCQAVLRFVANKQKISAHL